MVAAATIKSRTTTSITINNLILVNPTAGTTFEGYYVDVYFSRTSITPILGLILSPTRTVLFNPSAIKQYQFTRTFANSTEVIISGLAPNTNYAIKYSHAGSYIQSSTSTSTITGISPYGISDFVECYTLPLAPTSLIPSIIRERSLRLDYMAPSGTITNYVITYNISKASARTTTTSNSQITTPNTYVTITDLYPNTKYIFYITAENSNGKTTINQINNVNCISDKATSSEITTLPETPKITSVTENDTSILINFTGEADTYNLTDNQSSLSITINSPSKYFEIIDKKSSTVYSFVITASNVQGNAVSDPYSYTSKPANPNNLSVSDITSSQCTLKWNENLGGTSAITYDIYNKTTLAGTTNDMTYTITGLTSNTTYYFKVIAKGDGGTAESGYTAVTTLSSPPSSPSNAQTQNITQTTATLSFSPSTGSVSNYYMALTSPLPTQPELMTSSAISSYVASITGISSNVSTPSIDINNLTPNTQYTYQIVGIGSGGVSTPIPISFTTLPNIPAAPILSISEIPTITSALINFTMPAPDNTITGFILYSGTNAFSQVTSSPFLINNLKSNTTYPLRLTAINRAGTSDYSNTLNVMTLPDPPTNVTASNISETDVMLSFTPPYGSINNYFIYSRNEKIATCTTSPYSVTGLTQNTQYSFNIVASNSIGDSVASSTVTMKTLAHPPNAPSNLVVSDIKQTTASISFTPPNTPVSSYSLYAKNMLIMTITNPGIFSITGLTSNTQYSFTIIATNNAAVGSTSNPLVFTTSPDIPTDPTNLSVVYISPTKINLLFTPGNGIITGYKLYSNNQLYQIFNTTTTPISIIDLTPNTQYKFILTAFNQSGESSSVNSSSTNLSRQQGFQVREGLSNNNSITITTPPLIPTTPVLEISNIKNTSFDVFLQSNSSVVNSYNIYNQNQILYTTTEGRATISGLSPNTVYSISATATNTSGESIPTTFYSITTLPVLPSVVTNLQKISVGQTSITISFNASPDTELISQYVSNEGIGSGTPSNYTIMNLNPGTSYSIIITAKNQTGTSGPSSPLAISTSANNDMVTTYAPTDAVTTYAPTAYITTDAPTAYVTTDAPMAYVSTDAPTTYVTTDASTAYVTTDAPTTYVTTDAPTTYVTTDAPTTDSPIAFPQVLYAGPTTYAPTTYAPTTPSKKSFYPFEDNKNIWVNAISVVNKHNPYEYLPTHAPVIADATTKIPSIYQSNIPSGSYYSANLRSQLITSSPNVMLSENMKTYSYNLPPDFYQAQNMSLTNIYTTRSSNDNEDQSNKMTMQEKFDNQTGGIIVKPHKTETNEERDDDRIGGVFSERKSEITFPGGTASDMYSYYGTLASKGSDYVPLNSSNQSNDKLLDRISYTPPPPPPGYELSYFGALKDKGRDFLPMNASSSSRSDPEKVLDNDAYLKSLQSSGHDRRKEQQIDFIKPIVSMKNQYRYNNSPIDVYSQYGALRPKNV